MFRPVLAVAVAFAAINVLSSSVVAIPSPAFRTPIGGITHDFWAPPNFLPIISNSICAEPPGTIATDGCDDVCLLTKCCKNWVPSGGSVTLQNKNNVDCSTVDCGNVCRMVCDREPTTEQCSQTCGELMSSGTAFVFSRNGSCTFTGVPYVSPSEPTHVGFGFEVAPDVYVFGSLENGAGLLVIAPGSDNGFWMTTGSKEQMLATFRDPGRSGFHGTLHGNVVAPYDSYKMITVDLLFTVCDTVKAAENLYGAGYEVATNNCLDAVYNILYTYGVTFPTGVDPSSYWCPSGPSPNSFFAALTGDGWSAEQSLQNSPGSPVSAVSCPTTVTSSCVATQTPPSGGSGDCGGLDFSNCVLCDIVPICYNVGFGGIEGVSIAQCPTNCAQANPCICNGACNDGTQCWFYN